MIVCAALIVPPTSTVYAPQELAHKLVALDHGNGTAYAGLQMLEGAVPREAIVTCPAVTSPAERFAGLMRGDFAATVVQEPWITVAEKAGCRLVSTTFFHGTWVADRSISAEAYAAFVRATTRAVRRINADKRAYVSYYIRDFPGYPEVEALKPEDEARWAWEWMASWGVLQGAFDVTTQINRRVEREAHELARQ